MNHVPVYPSSVFDYNKSTKRMVADASDLSRGQFWGRLYPDSCDEGFGIRSDKTGKVEYFFLADEIRDNTADNELLAMEFLPIVSALEQTGLKVIVLND